MGLGAATIVRWADCAPVEREDAWPPFAHMPPGTEAEVVVRWNEGADPGWFWRQVIRFAYWKTKGRVCLTPQQLEFIGLASSEAVARVASLDGTYASFRATVDHFLPREPVNLPGIRFWKRRLHRLYWHREPEAVDEIVALRKSEWVALTSRIKALAAKG